MNIGDRFKKDGKLIEVTSVNDWGYGFKEVVEEEALPEDTVFDFPAEDSMKGDPEYEEFVERVVKDEKPKKVVRRRKKV